MEKLGYEAGIVKVTFEKVELVNEDSEPLLSTKKTREDFPLYGGIWEFKYVGT